MKAAHSSARGEYLELSLATIEPRVLEAPHTVKNLTGNSTTPTRACVFCLRGVKSSRGAKKQGYISTALRHA